MPGTISFAPRSARGKLQCLHLAVSKRQHVYVTGCEQLAEVSVDRQLSARTESSLETFLWERVIRISSVLLESKVTHIERYSGNLEATNDDVLLGILFGTFASPLLSAVQKQEKAECGMPPMVEHICPIGRSPISHPDQAMQGALRVMIWLGLCLALSACLLASHPCSFLRAELH